MREIASARDMTLEKENLACCAKAGQAARAAADIISPRREISINQSFVQGTG
jgi:hypothetical protein